MPSALKFLFDFRMKSDATTKLTGPSWPSSSFLAILNFLQFFLLSSQFELLTVLLTIFCSSLDLWRLLPLSELLVSSVSDPFLLHCIGWKACLWTWVPWYLVNKVTTSLSNSSLHWHFLICAWWVRMQNLWPQLLCGPCPVPGFSWHLSSHLPSGLPGCLI